MNDNIHLRETSDEEGEHGEHLLLVEVFVNSREKLFAFRRGDEGDERMGSAIEKIVYQL